MANTSCLVQIQNLFSCTVYVSVHSKMLQVFVSCISEAKSNWKTRVNLDSNVEDFYDLI